MNREIKFRAWDASTKEMHRPEDKRHDTVLTASANILKHFDCVMQFTGLLDKNGKEIYEGDIIREKNVGHLYDEITTRTVVYGNGGFFAKEGNGSCFLGNINLRYEVVGNIYENPEPLK